MKVALFLAEGFEELEAITIIDVLRRGGIDLKTFGLNSNNIKGSHYISVKTDDIFRVDKLINYDAIIFPGGLAGVTILKNNQSIIEVVMNFNDNNKYIAAICAAPLILDKAGVLKDKTVTCYPALKDNLTNISKYSDACVVIDKNIITSQGPATAMDFALTLLDIWTSKEKSLNIARDLLLS